MKIAIYARVSTLDQAEAINIQLTELREYASRRGATIVQEFTDVGVSGTKQKRPGLNALMDAARKRKFDSIVVWKFDRFGRSLSHLVDSLKEFNELGIAFISYTQNIDTGTTTGKLMFNMLASFAEFERDLIVERVNAGIKLAKARGIHCGRPATVNNAKIIELFKGGMKKAHIAQKLGIGVASVHRALRAS